MSTGLLPIVLALAPFGAHSPPPRSIDEAWSRLATCEAPPRHESWVTMACGEAVRDVLRLGGEADRERLWDRYAQAAGPMRSLLFDGLVESHVSDALRALDGFEARPTTLSFEGVELPAGLENASTELKDAARLFHATLRHVWPDSAIPEGERVAYASEEGREQFEQLAVGFLRGGSDPAALRASLDRFEYGGRCGVGADAFFDTSAALRLVASIRQGRLDAGAAVAYVLGQAPNDGQEPALPERLLGAVGIDWEPLYLGAALAGRTPFVQPLVRAGSDRAARLLLEIAGLEPPGTGAGPDHFLLARLAGFVSSDGPCEGYDSVSSDDFGRAADAPPIGPDLQQSILEELARMVQPDAGLDAAKAAAHTLLRVCRVESRDAFSAMLRSPYSQVRERGAIGLRALGETVADPARAAPVAFRLMVDGRPWESEVHWTLEGPGGLQWSSGPADHEGVVRLDRDPFVDATAPIGSVQLATDSLERPDDVWFSVRFRPPLDLDDRTLLTVRTGSLTVVVPPAVQPSMPGALMLVQRSGEDEELVLSDLQVGAGRYVFPRLQHGHYQASVLLPDRTRLESPDVEVTERPATVELAAVLAEQEPDADDPEEPEPPRP